MGLAKIIKMKGLQEVLRVKRQDFIMTRMKDVKMAKKRKSFLCECRRPDQVSSLRHFGSFKGGTIRLP